MAKDFTQLEWDSKVRADCRAIARLAQEEDLQGQQDWTSVALVPPERRGAAAIVSRKPGIVSGMLAVEIVIEEFSADLTVEAMVSDGDEIAEGTTLATLSGSVRDLLTAERTVLNILGRMMGIATLAARYKQEIAGNSARIYDTRKTTPGWRRLEKYAVRCGGGCNHRTGLFDAILIKDNHLAQAGLGSSPGDAVRQARAYLSENPAVATTESHLIEVEVDRLDQLADVLPAAPDIVLLDNMSPEDLSRAVQLRNEQAPGVELEASGGVNLDSVAAIAQTGVDRISVGALTHSAICLDVGLDWQ